MKKPPAAPRGVAGGFFVFGEDLSGGGGRRP